MLSKDTFKYQVKCILYRTLWPSRDASVTETGRFLRDFYNTLCSGHPTRLLLDSFTTDWRDRCTTVVRHPTTCVTDPRLAHDRYDIIILIHDRRTTPSRRFQDLCVTLLGYVKTDPGGTASVMIQLQRSQHVQYCTIYFSISRRCRFLLLPIELIPRAIGRRRSAFERHCERLISRA